MITTRYGRVVKKPERFDPVEIGPDGKPVRMEDDFSDDDDPEYDGATSEFDSDEDEEDIDEDDSYESSFIDDSEETTQEVLAEEFDVLDLVDQALLAEEEDLDISSQLSCTQPQQPPSDQQSEQ